MQIEQERLDALFADVASEIRMSIGQSDDSVTQRAYARLSRNPLDIPAIDVIAASHLRTGNAARAFSVLKRDASILPGNPSGQRIAGYACLIQGHPEDGKTHFEESVRLDPCRADCWAMLGRIAETIGDSEMAIQYYRRAIVFDDPQHESALALSRIHCHHRRLKDAIHALRVALLRDRRSSKLNLALATLLERRAMTMLRRRNHSAQHRFIEEAHRCYQTASASAPTAATFVRQGLLELRLERFSAARISFESAIALDPTCPVAATNLANMSLESGEIQQSVEQYQQALSIDPDRAATHFRYSRAQRFKASAETESYISQLSALIHSTDRPAHDKVQLNFALAKVLDDIGRYDQAWSYYDRANRLKRGHSQSVQSRTAAVAGQSAQPNHLSSIADKAIDFFTQPLIQSNRNVGNPSATPVFIVGMPRSGTTLTEQILSSHSAVAGAGELQWIERIRQQIICAVGRRAGAEFAGAANDLYPQLLMSLDRSCFRAFADQYMSNLDQYRTTEMLVSDKMPTNFMHLGLIALLFPNATIIHCRRNPMDVLASCYCQNLNAPFCDLDQLVEYHRQYRRMMAHWERVLPMPIHTVDYESLVTDPESNVRAMIEHCGLPWDDRCLEFHSNRRAVHTPSKWQVRQPMYSSSIEKWKRFERHLQPILESLREQEEYCERCDDLIDANPYASTRGIALK